MQEKVDILSRHFFWRFLVVFTEKWRFLGSKNLITLIFNFFILLCGKLSSVVSRSRHFEAERPTDQDRTKMSSQKYQGGLGGGYGGYKSSSYSGSGYRGSGDGGGGSSFRSGFCVVDYGSGGDGHSSGGYGGGSSYSSGGGGYSGYGGGGSKSSSSSSCNGGGGKGGDREVVSKGSNDAGNKAGKSK